ncbi:MAG: alpha/beta fold hydrolase [Acidobacteriota bacterium]
MRRTVPCPENRRSCLPSGLAAVLLASLLGACSASSVAPDHVDDVGSGSVVLFDETLALEDGGTLSYQRGIATVPLRRDRPGSGTVEVEFFRFRRAAEAAPDTPPIVILHGGPGFEGLGPRLERPGYFEARLARYTQIADVVVPGQRGFGSSGATPCEPVRELSVEEALEPAVRQRAISEATARCRDRWRSDGLDLVGFNVVEASADVAEIARHLGYRQIQLRGTSFGSHWGLAILRDHPKLVARATLAGLEGPDHTYDRPGGVLAALEQIAAAAEASPALAPRIPDGGLLAAYSRLVERADLEPIAVEVDHPQTGDAMTIPLDGDALRHILHGTRRFTSFRFRMPQWPVSLLEMVEGDLRAAGASHVWNLLDPELENAAYYQYDCGSGISAARRKRLQADPAVGLLGPTWRRLDGFCEAWDADLGEGFREPFRTAVPTVLVQGTWDTSTPFENAVELRPFFADHHFVQVEGGSHGALREAIEEVPGFREAMDRWLATGEVEQLPGRVELPPVEWR